MFIQIIPNQHGESTDKHPEPIRLDSCELLWKHVDVVPKMTFNGVT